MSSRESARVRRGMIPSSASVSEAITEIDRSPPKMATASIDLRPLASQ
jgi:hypothetical protein